MKGKYKNNNNDVIEYPQFIQCINYTDDVFWQNIFTDLAYGKTPYGIYIAKNDFLCCSFKNREFNYKIENKPGEVLYKEIFKLFSTKMNILSNVQKLDMKDKFKILQKNNILNSDWASIKKKNLKDYSIEKYVIEMKNKHSLNIKQTKRLFSIITICAIFKIINTENINYENGNIQSIDCINYENGKVLFDENLFINNISKNPEIVLDNKVYMCANWNKFIESILKKIS